MLIVTVFILVLLPSMSLVSLKLITNRTKITRLLGYCYFCIKCIRFYSHLLSHLRRYNEIPIADTKIQSNENEIDIIIDDSKRINATICDV